MDNILSKKFDTTGLLKFVLPSVIMMVFISIYSMMGSILAGQYIGEYALSAISIVFPFVSFALAVAIMYTTGANAIVSSNLGAKENKKAKENFTVITILAFITGLVFTVIALCFTEQIITLLGGTENIMPYAKTYLQSYAFVFPFMFIGILANYFFVTEGKGLMGMTIVMISGSISILLNFLLMAVFKLGIVSAAIAMGVAYFIPTCVYLLYFSKKKNRTLHFVTPKLHKGFVLNTCTNGSSEMVTNLAIAIVSATMNIIMGNIAGESGIAAVSVIVQVQFLLNSMYIGFGAGVAPVFGYAHGADNREQTKSVFRISTRLVVISSIVLVTLCMVFRNVVVSAFISDTTSIAFDYAITGFSIFAIGYLFAGMNIFSSVFFTSVSNGKISALISFLRTFLFIMGMLMILPPILDTTGVWLAIPIAEALAVIVAVLLLRKYRTVYHYGDVKKGDIKTAITKTVV